MKKSNLLLGASLLLGLAATPQFAAADTAALTAGSFGFTKPSGLTEASLTAKVTEDTNIYGTDYNVTANTVAPASQTDVGNQSARILTISPKLTFDLLPLLPLGKDSPVSTLSLGYVGELNEFSKFAGTENNFRSTLNESLRMVLAPVKVGLDDSFLYVDGSKADPLQQTNNAYSSALPRERRNQIQEKLAGFAKVSAGAFFVRPTVSLQYYNLLINEQDSTKALYKDYVNYVNRSDISVGGDVGCDLTKDFSAFLSWRLGAQTQAKYDYTDLGQIHNDSTFNRVLAGIAGKPAHWLTVNWVIGPDFRRYADFANSAFASSTPSKTWLYEEGSLTATVSNADTITATSKVWHWVSSTGKNTYQDSSYGIICKHAFNATLSASVGYRLGVSKYDTIGNRNDFMRTFPFNLTYAPSKQVSVSLDFVNNGSHSHAPIADGVGRQFQENVYSLSVKFAL